MVDFETLLPQDATVLWFFFASLTIYFTVRGDNMHLRPLPGKFATKVVCGMFNRLCIFFVPITRLV